VPPDIDVELFAEIIMGLKLLLTHT